MKASCFKQAVETSIKITSPQFAPIFNEPKVTEQGVNMSLHNHVFFECDVLVSEVELND